MAKKTSKAAAPVEGGKKSEEEKEDEERDLLFLVSYYQLAPLTRRDSSQRFAVSLHPDTGISNKAMVVSSTRL